MRIAAHRIFDGTCFFEMYLIFFFPQSIRNHDNQILWFVHVYIFLLFNFTSLVVFYVGSMKLNTQSVKYSVQRKKERKREKSTLARRRVQWCTLNIFPRARQHIRIGCIRWLGALQTFHAACVCTWFSKTDFFSSFYNVFRSYFK